MKFFNISANYNFLESLYNFVLEKCNNKINTTDLTIFLPSRRSVNELKRIFLKNSDKKSLILPTIKAIGDIDYDDIFLTNLNYKLLEDYSDVTKPTNNIKYKLLLIKKIFETSKDINLKQAINLSNELEKFLKEIEQQELNLDDLDNLVDDEYAIHWQKILLFLKDFNKNWQKFLQNNNIISNDFSIVKKIELYTKNIEINKPKNPIIVAGNFVSIKATLNLIKVLQNCENTFFIFKDFEDIKQKYNSIEKIDNTNKNYYFYQLIKELKIDSKIIQNIKYEHCKVIDDNELNILHYSMIPSDLTYQWHNINNIDLINLSNIKYMECDNIYEEYELTTLYILNFIKNNGIKNIAVITDIEHANQLELYLKKWNLPINNTFGKKYLDNQLVQYILLIIEVYIKNFNKESLLTLLKNNLTFFDYDKNELECYIKNFEKYVLDNTKHCDGLKSYKKDLNLNLNNKELRDKLINFIDTIDNFFSIFNKNEYNFTDLLILHLKLVEKITKNKDNNDVIWYLNDTNSKIFQFFNENLLPQVEDYGKIKLEEYYDILKYILSQQSYSDNYSIYPAINLITSQEARLINYDLVIINNLNEGTFPKNIPTDPWMSRSMREKFGLPAKEIEIGKLAYDFIQLISQKEVLLTRSIKVDGVATFKSRFLQRFETLLACNKIFLKNKQNEFKEAYKKLNTVTLDNICLSNKRPYPIPSISVRPKTLSATYIDLLNQNPYDIYAKYILNLRPINILTEIKISAKLGTILHSVFEKYDKNYNDYKDNKLENLQKLLTLEIEKNFIDDNISKEIYLCRFNKIIEDFKRLDDKSREYVDEIITEKQEKTILKECGITLEAKIDRIEKDCNNNINIVDYKTGNTPTKTDVKSGKKLQLLIEAFILNNQYNMHINSLQYWQIKYKNSKQIIIDDNINDLIEKTKNLLIKLFEFFANEKNGYIATNKNSETTNYKQLSRIDDWLN